MLIILKNLASIFLNQSISETNRKSPTKFHHQISRQHLIIDRLEGSINRITSPYIRHGSFTSVSSTENLALYQHLESLNTRSTTQGSCEHANVSSLSFLFTFDERLTRPRLHLQSYFASIDAPLFTHKNVINIL